jgi:hypothetical protein
MENGKGSKADGRGVHRVKGPGGGRIKNAQAVPANTFTRGKTEGPQGIQNQSAEDFRKAMGTRHFGGSYDIDADDVGNVVGIRDTGGWHFYFQKIAREKGAEARTSGKIIVSKKTMHWKKIACSEVFRNEARSAPIKASRRWGGLADFEIVGAVLRTLRGEDRETDRIREGVKHALDGNVLDLRVKEGLQVFYIWGLDALSISS